MPSSGLTTQSGPAHSLTLLDENRRKKKRKNKLKRKRKLMDASDEIVEPESHTAMRPKKKHKKRKAVPAAASAAAAAAAVVPPAALEERAAPPSWPFDPHPADHCETPLAAYRELVPALHRLAEALALSHGCDGLAPGGVSALSASIPSSDAAATSRLRIYDPYFCTGRVKEHLGTLGFTLVGVNVCVLVCVWGGGGFGSPIHEFRSLGYPQS